MTASLISVHAPALRDLLRLSREVALQLDADRSDEPNLVEIQLLRAVESVEAELDADARPSWHDVRTTRVVAPRTHL